MFTLAPELARDCVTVCDLTLCRVLLVNDAQYPWFILVPKLSHVTEIHELSNAQRHRFWDESNLLTHAMKNVFSPDKMNVAALGNRVAQLHLHHIARYTDDPAWPDPVWGLRPPIHYDVEAREELKEKIMTQLNKEIKNDFNHNE